MNKTINKKIGRVLIILGVIIASAFILLVIVIAVMLGGLGSNKAQQRFKPIEKDLKTIDAKFICDNGDAGHGIDNSVPWYQAYYSVRATPNIQSQLESYVASAGYRLQPDIQTEDQLNGLMADKNTINLISPNKQLALSIAPAGSQTDLFCSNTKNYGQARISQPGEDVLNFNISLQP